MDESQCYIFVVSAIYLFWSAFTHCRCCIGTGLVGFSISYEQIILITKACGVQTNVCAACDKDMIDF